MKKGSERAIEVNIELNQTLALKIRCKKLGVKKPIEEENTELW